MQPGLSSISAAKPEKVVCDIMERHPELKLALSASTSTVFVSLSPITSFSPSRKKTLFFRLPLRSRADADSCGSVGCWRVRVGYGISHNESDPYGLYVGCR